jgi:hypothetical protein
MFPSSEKDYKGQIRNEIGKLTNISSLYQQSKEADVCNTTRDIERSFVPLYYLKFIKSFSTMMTDEVIKIFAINYYFLVNTDESC